MENSNFIQPIDDGLALRDSGPWVAEKLCYVGKYLNAFSQSMGAKPWRNIRYIDLFSGPGKCVVRDSGQIYLGSPLLALTTKRFFTDYVFVDMDSENIASLNARTQPYQNKTRISCLVGNSNKEVKKIVSDILDRDKLYIRGSWKSLNLAFIDPEGLELDWYTIVELARTRTDLIINYSQSGITRTIDNCAQVNGDTALDHYFGGDGWRKIYENHYTTPGDLYSKLIDLYHSQLTALGYVDVQMIEYHFEPLMRTSKTNTPLYRLIFASKSKLGYEIWNKVTKIDVHGQKRFV